MHYTEFDTRLGSYAVIVDPAVDSVGGTGRVLLALWNEGAGPFWTLPGGGVEYDESVEDGAVREVFEESGYQVVLDSLLGVDHILIPAERRQAKNGRPMKGVRVIFSAHVVGGVLTAEIGGTTDEARWFDLDEVPALARLDLVDVGLKLWAERSPLR